MEVQAGSPRRSQKHQMLKDKQVKDLIVDKRRLVEVPYTATLADTMKTLMVNKVVAVPVAAPPGHWIGAGGSMILESDKQTGAVRKHYIGMVNMLDILAHIAGNGSADDADLTKKMMVPVSSIIGHCLESLSLWTLSPNTRYLELTSTLIFFLMVKHYFSSKLKITEVLSISYLLLSMHFGYCVSSSSFKQMYRSNC